MRIHELVNEDQEDPSRYEKLNAFRKFKSGPDPRPSKDFGDDQIVINNQPINKTSKTSQADSVSGNPEFMAKNQKQRERAVKIKNIFDTFNLGATDHGKQPINKPYKDGSAGVGVHTNNNVKVQIGIKSSSDIAAIYVENITKENKEYLQTLLEEMGYKLDTSVGSKFRFLPSNPSDLSSTLKEFWNIVEAIEDLGEDFKSSSGARGRSVIKQAPFKYYLWAALNFYNSRKFDAVYGYSRGGGEGAYDKNDRLITIGITKGGIAQQNTGRAAYREHVVPIDFMNKMGDDICAKYSKTQRDRNKVIKELADMIYRNLAIVLCSSPPKDSDKKSVRDPENPTEQEIIDKKFRTTMPPGWKDGDSILARFEYFDIPVYKNKSNSSENGKRIAEE
jgi:hypothetical protein